MGMNPPGPCSLPLFPLSGSGLPAKVRRLCMMARKKAQRRHQQRRRMSKSWICLVCRLWSNYLALLYLLVSIRTTSTSSLPRSWLTDKRMSEAQRKIVYRSEGIQIHRLVLAVQRVDDWKLVFVALAAIHAESFSHPVGRAVKGCFGVEVLHLNSLISMYTIILKGFALHSHAVAAQRRRCSRSLRLRCYWVRLLRIGRWAHLLV